MIKYIVGSVYVIFLEICMENGGFFFKYFIEIWKDIDFFLLVCFKYYKPVNGFLVPYIFNEIAFAHFSTSAAYLYLCYIYILLYHLKVTYLYIYTYIRTLNRTKSEEKFYFSVDHRLLMARYFQSKFLSLCKNKLHRQFFERYVRPTSYLWQ